MFCIQQRFSNVARLLCAQTIMCGSFVCVTHRVPLIGAIFKRTKPPCAVRYPTKPADSDSAVGMDFKNARADLDGALALLPCGRAAQNLPPTSLAPRG